LDRPPEYDDEISVRPGLHHARKGGHPVVWWDPSMLPPSVEEHFGRRQEEILADDPSAVSEGLREHDEWLTRRAALLADGARPSLELTTASEAEQGPPDFACEILIDSTARNPQRPSGKRFGALLHNILGVAPLEAGRPEIEAIAKLQGRLLASPKEEVEAAARAAGQALGHPLLDRARNAVRCHREYPVVFHRPDREEAVLEGIIDLAFEEQSQWVVIDFKSDADLTPRIEEYRAQISWYAFALQQIKGKPVECWLLQV
jgi:ATP-dependent exoDNAse (exonuclease V) beta subunit